MTDRELLTLAAKAAGICLHPADKLKHSYGNWGCDTTCTVCKEDPSSARWNPLKDDGDALRLAVKLRMRISISEADAMATAYIEGAPQGYAVDFGDDPDAATRMAIVDAAAAAGKSMP